MSNERAHVEDLNESDGIMKEHANAAFDYNEEKKSNVETDDKNVDENQNCRSNDNDFDYSECVSRSDNSTEVPIVSTVYDKNDEKGRQYGDEIDSRNTFDCENFDDSNSEFTKTTTVNKIKDQENGCNLDVSIVHKSVISNLFTDSLSNLTNNDISSGVTSNIIHGIVNGDVSDDNNTVTNKNYDVIPEKRDVDSKAPDGGWGWVVVFASFMTHFIVDGISFSMGVFYVVSLDVFQDTKSNTSWLGSIMTSSLCMVALLAGVLSDTFGFRVVSILGSVIATCGFALSAFAQSIPVLYVTLGGMVGIGLGFMIFPSVVCVQHYFDKRRTLAMGISVAGSGIGTFALAPFQRWLADLVGWRHLMIVLAGVSFTGTFLGILYKPPPKHKTDSSVEVLGDLQDTELGLEEKMPSKTVDMVMIKDTEYECDVFKTTMKYAQDLDDGTVKSKDDLNSKELQLNQSQIIENDTKERDINPKTTTGVNTTPPIHHSLQPENKGSFTTCFDKCCRDGAVGVIHWSLLKEPSFVVWLVCFFGCQFAVVVPLTFMPDSAMERNIGGPEAAFLISVIGIVNIAARPIIGFVADRNHVRHHRLKLLATGAFIGGVALIVNPFCKTYATLVIVVILMGLSQGACILLMPVVLRDLFGLGKLNTSIGFTLVIVGISTMLVPVLGWVTDVTGSYDVTFYISGGVVITCSFAMATITRCQKETIDAEVPCLANIPDLDAAIVTTAGIL